MIRRWLRFAAKVSFALALPLAIGWGFALAWPWVKQAPSLFFAVVIAVLWVWSLLRATK